MKLLSIILLWCLSAQADNPVLSVGTLTAANTAAGVVDSDKRGAFTPAAGWGAVFVTNWTIPTKSSIDPARYVTVSAPSNVFPCANIYSSGQVMPSIGSTLTLTTRYPSWMLPNEPVRIFRDGYTFGWFTIAAIDGTSVTYRNDGSTTNKSAGTSMSSRLWTVSTSPTAQALDNSGYTSQAGDYRPYTCDQKWSTLVNAHLTAGKEYVYFAPGDYRPLGVLFQSGSWYTGDTNRFFLCDGDVDWLNPVQIEGFQFYGANANNWLYGLQFSGYGSGTNAITGISCNNSGTNYPSGIVIDNCRFTSILHTAIRGQPAANVRVQNCYFGPIHTPTNIAGAGTLYIKSSLYQASTNWIVSNNVFENWSDAVVSDFVDPSSVAGANEFYDDIVVAGNTMIWKPLKDGHYIADGYGLYNFGENFVDAKKGPSSSARPWLIVGNLFVGQRPQAGSMTGQGSESGISTHNSILAGKTNSTHNILVRSNLFVDVSNACTFQTGLTNVDFSWNTVIGCHRYGVSLQQYSVDGAAKRVIGGAAIYLGTGTAVTGGAYSNTFVNVTNVLGSTGTANIDTKSWKFEGNQFSCANVYKWEGAHTNSAFVVLPDSITNYLWNANMYLGGYSPPY